MRQQELPAAGFLGCTGGVAAADGAVRAAPPGGQAGRGLDADGRFGHGDGGRGDGPAAGPPLPCSGSGTEQGGQERLVGRRGGEHGAAGDGFGG